MAEEVTLSTEDIPVITAPALAERHARVRGFLARLMQNPPQVLLIEGGTVEERVSMALYWAALVNCTASADGAPCLHCEGCTQMLTMNHRDMFFLDGRQDRIKIDQIRGVRGVLGEPPRGSGRRVIILAEAQSLGIEAANGLLKSLEEPRPGNSFLLLAPQRERLLPTLVSRSWVLTLAWPQHTAPDAEVEEWAQALAAFVATGTGWFAKTSARGSLDGPTGKRIIARCRAELVAAITSRPVTPPAASPDGAAVPEDAGSITAMPPAPTGKGLAHVLATLSPAALRTFDEVLAESQEALEYNVNPALVMDWMATKLSLLRV